LQNDVIRASALPWTKGGGSLDLKKKNRSVIDFLKTRAYLFEQVFRISALMAQTITASAILESVLMSETRRPEK
jgi:hypothetical protein